MRPKCEKQNGNILERNTEECLHKVSMRKVLCKKAMKERTEYLSSLNLKHLYVKQTIIPVKANHKLEEDTTHKGLVTQNT